MRVKKEFLEKVLREGTVNTEKYRYKVFDTESETLIKRISLRTLGIIAFGGWELVAIFEKEKKS